MDITSKSWTYSHALFQDFTTDRKIFSEYEKGTTPDKLKNIILNEVCKDCSKTKAFNNFVFKLTNMKSNDRIITYVSDCYLKGADLGTIK